MQDQIYIYKNTFQNLLNLIDTLIEMDIRPFNIKNTLYAPTLLEQPIYLANKEKQNITKKYQKLVGNTILKISYYVFLSTEENKELIIYYFLLNSLKYKEKTIYRRNLKCVEKALKISRYVSKEAHRFKGFTRFTELKSHVLYATIHPENDILELLSNHFKERLKNQYWIIKDMNRDKLSIYDKNHFYIVNQSDFNLLDLSISENEEKIEKMWKSFYKTIGIKERQNERCRRNFMPKKFWKYMLEVRDELEKGNK